MKAKPRKKALVFEDSEEDFIPINDALNSVGYQVTRASTPDEFRKHKPYDKFQLILMDIFLGRGPDKQEVGLTLTEHVHQVNLHVPVVVVSSNEPSRKEVAEAFRLGASDYVDKDELLRDISAALSRVQAMAENQEELRLEAQLPLPIAFLYRDLRRSHTSFKQRLERMVELFEVTIKVVTFSLLAAHRTNLREVLRKELRASLAQPSLGHLLSVLAQLPEPDNFLHHLMQVVHRRDFREISGSFVQLRNDYIGHGAPQREPVYQELVLRYQPKIEELLHMLGCFLDWQLVFPLHSESLRSDDFEYELKVFRGSNPEPIVRKRVASLALKPTKSVHLVDGAFQESVDLFPWCQYLVCEQCKNEKLFLYRMGRHGEVWMIDHIYGHALQTRSGWSELQALLALDSPS